MERIGRWKADWKRVIPADEMSRLIDGSWFFHNDILEVPLKHGVWNWLINHSINLYTLVTKGIKQTIDSFITPYRSHTNQFERLHLRAKSIELDSIIKVVRANWFSDFILEKLQEFFPERRYTRAVKMPTEYFGEKFHILPENIKGLFRYCIEVADKAVKPTEDEIEEELDHWTPTDAEIERGIARLLKIQGEYALIEWRTSKAVAYNLEMRSLDKLAGALLDSPPLLKRDNDDGEGDDQQ